MNQLQRILATSLPICVAGGAAISHINSTIPHNDYDVYVLHYLWLTGVYKHIESLGPVSSNVMTGPSVRTYTFEDPKLKPIQVILGPSTIKAILNSFDFTCCGVALDTTMFLHTGPLAKDHIEQKVLHWNKFISVRHALDRISKYEKKGFTPTKKLLQQLLFNVELPGGLGEPTTFFNAVQKSAIWTPAYDV